MRKAGEYLKNIREEKGYSVEQVSKNTKISASVIRALEGGRLDNVNPVYLKGFLKLYCRFLGIVWADFLKEHPLPILRPELVEGPSRRVKETPESNAYSGKPEGDGLASNSQSHKPEGDACLPARQAAASRSRSHKKIKEKSNVPGESLLGPAFSLNNKKNIFIILLIIASLLSLAVAYQGFVLVKERIPRIQFPQIKSKSRAAVHLKKPPQKVIKENKPFKSQILPKKSPQQAVSNVKVQVSGGSTMLTTGSIKETKPKAITVVVRAQEDNFLKVKVDAQMVYQGVLRKGKAESWTAKEKIELFIADAGAAVLEIDGKVFSSLGSRGQPIKNILINSEGLKVL